MFSLKNTGIDMPPNRKKENLPQKDCLHCGRTFSWRKKWEKCWEEVKYCGERCRRQARSGRKKQ